MKILEHFYENPPKNEQLFARKRAITQSNTVVCGPPLSGKSALITAYLHRSGKNFLYLDMDDLRISKTSLNELPRFVTQEEIDLLAVDNYDGSFMLPQVPLVIGSRTPMALEGFAGLQLHPPDFEEFLAASQGTQTQAFNTYLKAGGKDEIGYQHLAKAFLGDKTPLFMHLCALAARPVSINQIYGQLKAWRKISKDWLYKSIAGLENEGFIRFVSKHDAPRGARKLFITNQEFLNALGVGVGFLNLFQNLVVNEVIKKERTFTYLEQNSYLIHTTLLKIEPFASEEASWVRVQKNAGSYTKAKIQKVIIITVSSSFEFEVGSLACEAMPFYEWALLDEW